MRFEPPILKCFLAECDATLVFALSVGNDPFLDELAKVGWLDPDIFGGFF